LPLFLLKTALANGAGDVRLAQICLVSFTVVPYAHSVFGGSSCARLATYLINDALHAASAPLPLPRA